MGALHQLQVPAVHVEVATPAARASMASAAMDGLAAIDAAARVISSPAEQQY